MPPGRSCWRLRRQALTSSNWACRLATRWRMGRRFSARANARYVLGPPPELEPVGASGASSLLLLRLHTISDTGLVNGDVRGRGSLAADHGPTRREIIVVMRVDWMGFLLRVRMRLLGLPGRAAFLRCRAPAVGARGCQVPAAAAGSEVIAVASLGISLRRHLAGAAHASARHGSRAREVAYRAAAARGRAGSVH